MECRITGGVGVAIPYCLEHAQSITRCIEGLEHELSEAQQNAMYWYTQCRAAYRYRDLAAVQHEESEKELVQIRAKLEQAHSAEDALAQVADILNSWAREAGVEQADRPHEARYVADRLWALLSTQVTQAEARARRLEETLRAVAVDLEEDGPAYLYPAVVRKVLAALKMPSESP